MDDDDGRGQGKEETRTDVVRTSLHFTLHSSSALTDDDEGDDDEGDDDDEWR